MSVYSRNNLHACVVCYNHNSQEVGTQVPTDGGKEQECVMYAFWEVLYRFQRKKNHICDDKDELVECNIK